MTTYTISMLDTARRALGIRRINVSLLNGIWIVHVHIPCRAFTGISESIDDAVTTAVAACASAVARRTVFA